MNDAARKKPHVLVLVAGVAVIGVGLFRVGTWAFSGPSSEDKAIWCAWEADRQAVARDASALVGDFPAGATEEERHQYMMRREGYTEPRLNALVLKHFGSVERWKMASTAAAKAEINCSY